jgi:hypothetical protein
MDNLSYDSHIPMYAGAFNMGFLGAGTLRQRQSLNHSGWWTLYFRGSGHSLSSDSLYQVFERWSWEKDHSNNHVQHWLSVSFYIFYIYASTDL